VQTQLIRPNPCSLSTALHPPVPTSALDCIMAGNSAADTPFAKLCGDCRYLISCLEDSLLKLRNSSDKFPMITVERPVPLSFKDWLASPKDGCVVCLELMDSLMQKYRSEVPLVDGLSPYLILLYNGYGPLELESKFIYFEVRAGPIVVTVEIVSRQASRFHFVFLLCPKPYSVRYH
jgi:hypothetical protein